MMLGAALFSASPLSRSAEDVLQERFENPDFMDGKPGAFPPGWHLGAIRAESYSALTEASGACHLGTQCASLRSIIPENNEDFSFLYQVINARQYRGKKFRFRAAVRAEVSSVQSVARLLIRIHRVNGETSLRDDMGNHPITSGKWDFYEIAGEVASDARDIEFGLQLFGNGTAWIDQISLSFSN